MIQRLTKATTVALLISAAAVAPVSAAMSGFGRPADPSKSDSRSDAPSAKSAPPSRPAPAPPAVQGYGRPASSAAPANRPSGLLDKTVNGAVSKDALDAYKARQAPPAPANDAPKAATATPAPAPGFPPQGRGYVPPASTPAAPVPAAPPVVVVHHDYGYRSDPSDFTNGLLVGTLLGQVGNRRSDGHYDDDEARRHLRDIAANTTDPDIRRRIDERLGPVVDNPAKVGATRDAPRSGGHGTAWVLAILAILAAAGAVAFLVLRRRRLPVVPGRTVAPVEPLPAATPVARVERDVAGMNFRTGGYVDIPEEDLVLAGANGSGVPETLSGRHPVEAVGRYVHRGIAVERAYFDDGKAFLEKASSGDAERQVRLYRLADEQTPDPDEWATFLGGKGADGVDREGYIGSPSVILPPSGHSWYRSWGTGDAQVAPERVTERVEGRDPGTRSHALMQYFREIGKDTEGRPAFEYAYLGSVEDGRTAVIRTWVGIDIPGDAAKAA